jgi:long-chain fatty acid transport protein
MGGAGVALPTDAAVAAINPAGMGRLGNEMYISPGWVSGHRTMDVQGNPAVVNIAGRQNSAKNNFFQMSSGVNFRPSANLAYGISFTGIGGMGTKYREPRTLAGKAGGYDNTVFYGLVHMLPTVAWSPRRNLTFGLSGVIGYSQIKGNPPSPTFAAPRANLKMDRAWGLGAKFGLLWDPYDWLSLGFAISSPVWFESFKSYDDVIRSPVNTPLHTQFGFAWHVDSQTDLAVDFRYIAYSHVTVIGKSPDAGGFGWEDVRALLVGVQHRLTERWILRAGFQISDSALPKEHAFAGALVPGHPRRGFGIGAAYKVSDKWEISADFEGILRGGLTDDGSGGVVSALGAGTRVQGYAYGGNLGVLRRF